MENLTVEFEERKSTDDDDQLSAALPEAARVFAEPGRGPANAIHMAAAVLVIGDEGFATHRRRTICGVDAPHSTGELVVHDDASTCRVCVEHRHAFGVRGPFEGARNIEASAHVALRKADYVRAVLP